MKSCSLKVRVGVYSGLVTIVSLLAGAAVLIPGVRHHQLIQMDRMMKDGADELLWDLVNFRDAPQDPTAQLEQRFLPFVLQRHHVQVEGAGGKVLYRSPQPLDAPLDVAVGQTRTIRHKREEFRAGAWQEGPYLVKVGVSLSPVIEFQDEIGRGLVIALPVAGFIALLGGMLLGRRAVAPVAELGEAAERIGVHAPTERLPLLVDQGEADEFLATQLRPELLREACAAAGHPLALRLHPGYDHSYYFIASFIDEHIAWHAAALRATG